MDDLIAFMWQQLDEDERTIREAAADYFYADGHGPGVSRWFQRWSPADPDGMLAEVAAKRRILGEHRPVEAGDVPGLAQCFVDNETVPCDHVLWLAQPYAGRPGWREEWTTA